MAGYQYGSCCYTDITSISTNLYPYRVFVHPRIFFNKLSHGPFLIYSYSLQLAIFLSAPCTLDQGRLWKTPAILRENRPVIACVN